MSSFSNFELIVVNDGSQDDTSEVLGALAQKDPRIKVVNKPNGGVSSARNAGLDVANGEFVIFVDDDDNVGPDYIKNLIDVEPDVDLVIDSFSDQIDVSPITYVDFPEIKIEGKEEILNFIFGEMQNYRYCFFPYGKRFKNAIIKKHKVRYKENINLGEDRPFVLDYLRHAKTMEVINTHSYVIRQISGSDYRLSKGVKLADYLLRNFRESYEFLIAYGKSCRSTLIFQYADNYLAEKVMEYLMIPMVLGMHSKDSVKNIKKVVPNLLKPVMLSNVKSRRNRALVGAIRLLGVGTVARVIGFRLKFK